MLQNNWSGDFDFAWYIRTYTEKSSQPAAAGISIDANLGSVGLGKIERKQSFVFRSEQNWSTYRVEARDYLEPDKQKDI